MNLFANQSNMLTLLLTLCVFSSWHTYDLRLDSKDNVISPEVYKESQSFLWNKNTILRFINSKLQIVGEKHRLI